MSVGPRWGRGAGCLRRQVTSKLGQNGALIITALAIVVALAWVYLLLGAQMGVQMMEGDGQTMAMPSPWSLGHAAIVFIMWAVMMVAMMLPSAAKTILLTTKLNDPQRSLITSRRTGEFVAGYLAVWLALSLLATGTQWALEEAGMLSATMLPTDNVLAGSLLVYAGAYQWSPLKQACLTHCITPQDFLDRHWRRDGPLLTGLRHGLLCLGCCWMLMALLFVGGLVNLVCIAVIAVTILVEKTLPRSIGTSSLIGTALIAGGGAELASLDFWRFCSDIAQLI